MRVNILTIRRVLQKYMKQDYLWAQQRYKQLGIASYDLELREDQQRQTIALGVGCRSEQRLVRA